MSSISAPSTLSTTINQVAAKNPIVGIAVAKESIDASILTDSAALAPTSEAAQLLGTANTQTDPTSQILGAVNAHIGQNFNVTV